MNANPARAYLKRVKALDDEMHNCFSVSDACAGIPSPTSAHYYASLLFTSLCTRALSLNILIPHSEWGVKKVEHWDFSSAAGLVRSILEVRLAFFYLCIEKCDEDEWNCRWNLFNLHDCTSRIHLFQQISNNEKHLSSFEEQAEELRQRLLGNRFFLNLDQKHRKKLMKGKTAHLSSLEEIAGRAGVELKKFRLLYKLFSSHIHGLPLSFYRMAELNRGRGVYSESEENWTSLCIEFAISLLATARMEMTTLFAVHLKSIIARLKIHDSAIRDRP